MNFYEVTFPDQFSPERSHTVSTILELENASFNSKPYSYICPVECKVGDFVLVETRYGIKVGKVNAEMPSKLNATKFIIGVIDISMFRRISEQHEVERKLLAQIATAMSKRNHEAQFRAAAESDPAIAALVAQLDEVRANGGTPVTSKAID